jgi:nitroreductase
MDAVKMIKERRSIRKYKDQVVEESVMNEIVEVSRYAPSWGNFQVARYTFVTDEEKINRLGTEGVNGFIYNTETLKNATNVAVLSFVQGKSGKLDTDEYVTSKDNTWEVFDAGIACQTFCLAAHEKGIGTVIMGVIDDETISSIVGLPDEETVAALIVYGYPEGEHPNATPRMDVNDLVRFV